MSQLLQQQIQQQNTIYASLLHFQRIKLQFDGLTLVYQQQGSKSITVNTDLTLQIDGVATEISQLSRLNIASQPERIQLVLTPSVNNVPISVVSASQKNALCLYFLKLNSRLKFGGLVINPVSGHFKFRVFTLFGQQFHRSLINPNKNQKTEVKILQVLLHAKSIFQYHLPKILHLINFKKFKNIDKPAKNKALLNSKYIEELELLENLASITHAEFSYAAKFKFALKSSTRKQFTQQTLMIINQFQTNAKILEPLKQLDQPKLLQLQQITSQKIDQNTSLANQMLSQFKHIQEKSIKVIKKIAQGGSSIVYLIQGQIKNRDVGNSKPRSFIKKVAKSSQSINRFLNQKKIVGIFFCQVGNQRELIPQYFKVGQQKSSQSQLYMQYFSAGTLEDFLFRREEFLTLTSKIHYILKLIKTLCHFHFHKVEHMDLKPRNICIDHRLNMRFIDFGQSYCEAIMKQINEGEQKIAYKPGVSLPYSAPQLYKTNFTQPYRCDIFSLGVMMFQIFFGFSPFNELRGELLINRFRDNSYVKQIRFLPQFVANIVQERIGMLIMELVVKCLAVNPKSRPSLDWIRLYLIKLSLILQNY